MKIYFPHSKQLEYEAYYEMIRNSSLFSQHTCILPYEKSKKPENSQSIIQSCDLVIAEVSYPGTGLGIELGWANSVKKLIICIYKYDFHPAASLKYVSHDFISYQDWDELIIKLEKVLKNNI
jgi:hypothetical protein